MNMYGNATMLRFMQLSTQIMMKGVFAICISFSIIISLTFNCIDKLMHLRFVFFSKLGTRAFDLRGNRLKAVALGSQLLQQTVET